jgi:hypothetical protein
MDETNEVEALVVVYDKAVAEMDANDPNLGRVGIVAVRDAVLASLAARGGTLSEKDFRRMESRFRVPEDFDALREHSTAQGATNAALQQRVTELEKDAHDIAVTAEESEKARLAAVARAEKAEEELAAAAEALDEDGAESQEDDSVAARIAALAEDRQEEKARAERAEARAEQAERELEKAKQFHTAEHRDRKAAESALVTLRLAVAALLAEVPKLPMPDGLSGDEESGEHDEDCALCQWEAIQAMADEAASTTATERADAAEAAMSALLRDVDSVLSGPLAWMTGPESDWADGEVGVGHKFRGQAHEAIAMLEAAKSGVGPSTICARCGQRRAEHIRRHHGTGPKGTVWYCRGPTEHPFEPATPAEHPDTVALRAIRGRAEDVKAMANIIGLMRNLHPDTTAKAISAHVQGDSGPSGGGEPTREEMEAALGAKAEAFAYGGTIRRCIDCRAPVFGGPTRGASCATAAPPFPGLAASSPSGGGERKRSGRWMSCHYARHRGFLCDLTARDPYDTCDACRPLRPAPTPPGLAACVPVEATEADADMKEVLAMTDEQVDAELRAGGVDVEAFAERTLKHVAALKAWAQHPASTEAEDWAKAGDEAVMRLLRDECAFVTERINAAKIVRESLTRLKQAHQRASEERDELRTMHSQVCDVAIQHQRDRDAASEEMRERCAKVADDAMHEAEEMLQAGSHRAGELAAEAECAEEIRDAIRLLPLNPG